MFWRKIGEAERDLGVEMPNLGGTIWKLTSKYWRKYGSILMPALHTRGGKSSVQSFVLLCLKKD